MIWLWHFRDVPAEHPAITRAELDTLPNQGAPAKISRPQVPWRALTTRMAPVTIVYFCYGWTLWLYLTWLPSYFLHEYQFDLRKSALFTSAVFFAGVVGDYLGGEISDRILHRTGDSAEGAPQRGDDRLPRLVRLPRAGLPHPRSRC